MGDPKKRKKQFQRPRKSYQTEKITKEKDAKALYGLKNKREYYRAESIVRTKRATARNLLALELEERLKREKELLDALKKIGILKGTPRLDDVLVLAPDALLERRLQTIVWRRGLANTVKQARQFITHGHIAINGRKITIPSYLVRADEEATIAYHKKPMMLETKRHEKVEKADETGKNLKNEFEEVNVAAEAKSI